MTTLVTQAEYARHRQCTQAAVRKAVLSGRITLLEGRIDPEVADIQWDRNTNRAKAARGAKLAKSAPTAVSPAEGTNQENSDVIGDSSPDFMTWKARREKAAALREELELAKLSGAVYDKEGVDRAARTAGRALRDQILAVPGRVAAELANITEPQAIESRLQAELRGALVSVERQLLAPSPGNTTSPADGETEA